MPSANCMPRGDNYPDRKGLYDCPVVLGHRGETWLDISGTRHDDSGEAIGAPAPGSSPVTAQHPVHRFDEVRLVKAFGQYAAHPP